MLQLHIVSPSLVFGLIGRKDLMPVRQVTELMNGMRARKHDEFEGGGFKLVSDTVSHLSHKLALRHEGAKQGTLVKGMCASNISHKSLASRFLAITYRSRMPMSLDM